MAAGAQTAAPMPWNVTKELTFCDAGIKEKLSKQMVWQVFLPPEEMAKHQYFNLNKLVVKFGDEKLGDAQIILVEKKHISKINVYEAMIAGYPTLEEFLASLKQQWGLDAAKLEKTDLFRILYRWI